METEKFKHTEATIAHMQMVQEIVSRLETNALTLKALAMTLAAAVLAFAGTVIDPTWVYPLAGLLPAVVFWLMDAQYLRLGRVFRRLFNAIRKGEIDDPFSMDIRPYVKQEQCTLRVAFSWSVIWFYLVIALSLGAVSWFFYCNGG